MTRRDFELIAGTLKDARWPADKLGAPTHNGAVDAVARDFAGRLRSTNPNFNRARFLTACGVEADA